MLVEQARLVAAHLRLAQRVEHLGLEVRDQQPEPVVGPDLDFDVDETAQDGDLRLADAVGVLRAGLARP